MTQREILVTHALPYANGPLHIGHLLGYIQSDIWVRARRMAGDTVHFVAADDVHGTPIMLAAEQAGMSPEEFIKGMQISHEADFRDFGVAHDYYYTTHSPENQQLAEVIYKRLRDAKPSHIATRAVRQFYDPVKQMFLPDRYIKGECPKCGTPDQYGDNCENCGATYAPTDLKNPRSVVSGATPELRDSEHYFFKVGDFTAMLRDWLAGNLTHGEPVAHSSVAAKLKEWLDAEGGLRDWDISRDAPYFGFPIPDAPGKFFYVWLDAPIGYLASFKKYCASQTGRNNGLQPESFERFMQRANNPDFDSTAEMHHFLGKDIVNFHGLFWPAMLEGAHLRTPTKLHVNGYLTVNGAKMSKSRGTFIQARTYLDAGLNPDYLRYYFATMLNAAPTDIDLDLKAFEERVNSHLVGKFVNIASRCAGFIEKQFDGRLAPDIDKNLRAHYHRSLERLQQTDARKHHYASGDFAQLVRDVMNEADFINALIAEEQPWKLAKDPSQRERLHAICTLAINYFRLLAIYLKPIIPATVARIETFLDEKLDHFSHADQLLLGKNIRPFQALITRIDPKQIETMIESSKESMSAPVQSPSAASASEVKSGKPTSHSPPPASAVISIDDFAKLDLRVGKVLQCGFVDGSDKLLRFELDAGELGKRQIFSGIKSAYPQPENLIGRNVVFIANLAPRKMRFGVSEGMILSAGDDNGLFLLDADSGAKAGMSVK
ncbi:MAG TPA: methionine--tRNA ligase [Rudaea sp.]|nr:methionine--tRNA ligase [Rudaea sp.]